MMNYRLLIYNCNSTFENLNYKFKKTSLFIKGFFMKTKVAPIKVFLNFSLLLFITLTQSCSGEKAISNLKIPGLEGPFVSLVNKKILIDAVFTDKTFVKRDQKLALPKLKKSFLKIGPAMESGKGTALAFSIDINDVLEESRFRFGNLTLPGGRPIPGIKGGTLPAISFSVKKLHNMVFYIGFKALGLWIPLACYTKKMIITKNFVIGKKVIGSLSLVGVDRNNKNAGVMLIINISAAQRKQLKKLARSR